MEFKLSKGDIELKKQRIYPGCDDINNFMATLMEGEIALARLIDKHLSSDWEVYVQPYLNGGLFLKVKMEENVLPPVWQIFLKT